MRSRYAAYALGGHADYLRKTWHPQRVASIGVADLEAGDYEWKGLEVLESIQKGDLGRVEFRAKYSDKGAPDQFHHERSAFSRHKGQWYYLDGEVSIEQA
jgi:SEC-C motif-containing protein